MDHSTIIDLCRLCATQNFNPEFTENILSTENLKRKNFLSLIHKYLQIVITDHESLPLKFCSSCIQKLQSFDTFSQRCLEVQEMFSSLSNGTQLIDEFAKSLLEYNRLNPPDSLNTVPQEATNQDNCGSNNVNNDNSCANDNISLAHRLNEKFSIKPTSDGKFKPIRPKKSVLKVPPLRIKAVKRKILINSANNECTHESLNTRYEIRENNVTNTSTNDKKIKATVQSSGITDVRNNDDDDVDSNDYFSDDFCLPNNDSKDTQELSQTNPFAIFEFKCYTCQEIFKNFSILKRHCKKEHGSSAYVNCVCGKQLRARTAIIEHRRKHTGTSLFKCDTCDKTFNRRSLMCLHMISHMPKDEQPYVCCKCAKRFHTSSLLKKHEKVHLPEEERFLDACNICQKKFTSKSAVNAHLRAVHYGEKPFVCEHCGNSFSSKAILTDHLTTHSPYAPWPCTVCGRNFKSKYRLNVHMDMHRSVKYRCPHCPMELSTRRTLRMHLLVHKEEKGYVCKVCSKAFRRSKDLKNHSNLHTGRRPYKCEFCERTFANGSNCRAHKLRMHPEELGVEKNCRSYSCKQTKTVTTNNNDHIDTANAIITTTENHLSLSVTATQDPLKSSPTVDFMKYETKYEFPTTSQDLDYSLDYARYPTPLNLNMKKPSFVQQPNMNHLAPFPSDMHNDVSRMHFLFS